MTESREDMIERIAGIAFGVMCKRLPRTQGRDEWIQVARIGAWRGFETYDAKQRASLETWMRSRAVWALLDERKRPFRKRNQVIEVSLTSMIHFDGDGHSKVLAAEDRKAPETDSAILKLIAMLSDPERAVMGLRYIAGLSPQDICGELAITRVKFRNYEESGLSQIKSMFYEQPACTG